MGNRTARTALFDRFAGHVPGAIGAPLEELSERLAERLAELPVAA